MSCKVRGLCCTLSAPWKWWPVELLALSLISWMYSDYRVLGSTEIVDMKDREPEKMTWLIDWGIKKENSELGLLAGGAGGQWWEGEGISQRKGGWVACRAFNYWIKPSLRKSDSKSWSRWKFRETKCGSKCGKQNVEKQSKKTAVRCKEIKEWSQWISGAVETCCGSLLRHGGRGIASLGQILENNQKCTRKKSHSVKEKSWLIHRCRNSLALSEEGALGT